MTIAVLVFLLFNKFNDLQFQSNRILLTVVICIDKNAYRCSFRTYLIHDIVTLHI